MHLSIHSRINIYRYTTSKIPTIYCNTTKSTIIVIEEWSIYKNAIINIIESTTIIILDIKTVKNDFKNIEKQK